jgi:hypothetical protein
MPELKCPTGDLKISTVAWSYHQALQYIGSNFQVSPASGSVLLWTAVEASGGAAHVVPLASGCPGSWDLIGPARVRQAVLPGWQYSAMQDSTNARAYGDALRSVQNDSLQYNLLTQ